MHVLVVGASAYKTKKTLINLDPQTSHVIDLYYEKKLDLSYCSFLLFNPRSILHCRFVPPSLIPRSLSAKRRIPAKRLVSEACR